jgi:alpha-L-rhamnosidase
VYGDRRIIERHYDAMARWIDYMTSNSVRFIRPHEGYGDWVFLKADTPKNLIATAWFAYSAALMSEMAAAIDRPDDAARYADLSKSVKAAFNKEFVDENVRITSDTQTAYVLALGMDLLPESKRTAAVNRLVELIRERDGHLLTGFVGVRDACPVLSRFGRLDVAYQLLMQDTYPSWGYMLKAGATTIWERWDGWTFEKGFQDRGNSYNHFAFGAIGEWMYANIGGIDTAAPGYKKIKIHPRPGGSLTWANCSYNSMQGMIRSEWKITGNDFELNVEIPPNAIAEVHLPSVKKGEITERGNPLRRRDGIQSITTNSGETVLHLRSGRYQFVSRNCY